MARSDDPPSASRNHGHSTGTNPSGTSTDSKEERHRYVGNYEILRTIGEGSFAKVKLGVHRLTGEKVAIKVIDKDRLPDAYSLRHVHREARIMRLLDHPNIVQLYEVMETKREVMLVLEYAGGGEVLDYIVAHGRLRESEAKRFMAMILDALIHCHSMNVVHRDLKAENLLLSSDNCIKISDFGLSNIFDPTKTLTTCCGSPVYSAPELIEGKRYVGPEVDAWSMGVNLYAMVVGDLPFADNNLSGLYDAILKGRYELPDYLSSECRDVITKLLVVNPKKRYTCAQARDHPWLASVPIEGPRRSAINPTPPSVSAAVHIARPHTEEEIDREVLDRLESYGFERAAALTSIIESRFDAAAGTYFLLKRKKNMGPENFANETAVMMQNSVTLGQANKIARGGSVVEQVETNGINVPIVKMSPFVQNAVDTTSEALAKVLISVERTRRMSFQGSQPLPPPPVREKVREKRPEEPEVQRGRPPSRQRRGPRNVSEPPVMGIGKEGGVGQWGTVGSLLSTENIGGKPADSKGLPAHMGGRRASYQADLEHEAPPSNAGKWVSGEHLRRKPSPSHREKEKEKDYKSGSLPRPPPLLPPISHPTSDSDGALRAGNAGGIMDINKFGTPPPSKHRQSQQQAPTQQPLSPPSKFKRARSRTIAIDESLYLSKELSPPDHSSTASISSSTETKTSPRTIRFAFNCSTTTTLPASTLFDRLRKALDRNGIDYNSEGFLCDCEAIASSNGITPPGGNVRFEAEVCKLPGLKMCGLRLRRIGGDMWEYKRLCGAITHDLEL
ncbi:MAP microtubule affinity-regulating kinase 1 [Rhizophlyctis rosea]|uniref:non-specific serine/threonine protein kinase n=1 Tax=Rhizophlyctis rosea TaxID=64517 RepID=A0AAD5SNH3_9FUNG|nr:MAP microtubule affinity-regulating kinase 1 [Rhizophlyctis rosea]